MSNVVAFRDLFKLGLENDTANQKGHRTYLEIGVESCSQIRFDECYYPRHRIEPFFQITQFETSIMEGQERGREHISGGQEAGAPDAQRRYGFKQLTRTA